MINCCWELGALPIYFFTIAKKCNTFWIFNETVSKRNLFLMEKASSQRSYIQTSLPQHIFWGRLFGHSLPVTHTRTLCKTGGAVLRIRICILLFINIRLIITPNTSSAKILKESKKKAIIIDNYLCRQGQCPSIDSEHKIKYS